MPDGSAMSMMWMPMPGQTWAGAAASFVGMWVVMMVPMMLPSLTPMLWRYRQVVAGTVDTPRRLADSARRRRLFLCLDGVRNAHLSVGRRAGGSRDATTGIGESGTSGRRRDCFAHGSAAVHCLEGAATRVLPGGAGSRLRAVGWRRHGVATRAAAGTPMQPVLWWVDADSPVIGVMDLRVDGCRNSGDHGRTVCAGRGAGGASHRGRGRWGRVVFGRNVCCAIYLTREC